VELNTKILLLHGTCMYCSGHDVRSHSVW